MTESQSSAPFYFMEPVVATSLRFRYRDFSPVTQENQVGNFVNPDPLPWNRSTRYRAGQLVASRQNAWMRNTNDTANVTQITDRDLDTVARDGFVSSTFNTSGVRFEPNLRVEDSSLNNIYLCLKDNTAVNPDYEELFKANPLNEGLPEVEEPTWAFVRKTNRFSFTDESPNQVIEVLPITRNTRRSIRLANGSLVGVPVAAPNEIRIALASDTPYDTIRIDNLQASRIVLQNGFDGLIPIELSNTGSVVFWSDYLSHITNYVDSVVIRVKKRRYSGANGMDIRLENPGGLIRCGQITLGNTRTIGTALASGLSIDSLDFSEVNRDDFGSISRTIRNAVFEEDVRFRIKLTQIAEVKKLIKKYRGGRPVAVSSSDDESTGTGILGIITGSNIRPDPQFTDSALVTLNMAGLS